MRARSVTTPSTNPTAMEANMASQIGQPCVVNHHATKQVNSAYSPWAKLMVPELRNTTTRASAMST